MANVLEVCLVREQLRHDRWNIRMVEHAAQELLESRVGQRPLEAPAMESPDQHSGPQLAWPMMAMGCLL